MARPEIKSERSETKPIIAICRKCKGRTGEKHPSFSQSLAMDFCWHKDGCPGGHDDRQFEFV